MAPLPKLWIAAAVAQSTQGFGFARFTLLKALNTSARKRRETLSVNAMSLATAMLLWKKPGPRSELRPALPNGPGAGSCQGPTGGPEIATPVNGSKLLCVL